jgi:hypothetical protein
VRVNFSAIEAGEEYLNRLDEEAVRNFQIFLQLLSSYWQSTIDGPNYTREIKAMSIELARLSLALGDVQSDIAFDQTRTEFIYQILTSVLFPDGAPETGLGDRDFRDFLLKILKIYFKGSIPSSIKEAVELFTDGQVTVYENSELAKNPATGLDVSDQFGFQVDIKILAGMSLDTFLADKNIRLLLNIIRPAHTLFNIRYIIEDKYNPNGELLVDQMKWALSSYNYDDFRRYFEGVFHVDTLGVRRPIFVNREIHTSSF